MCIWHAFRRPVIARLLKIKNIVKAAVVLHNFIIEKQKPDLNNEDLMDNFASHSTTISMRKNSTEPHDILPMHAVNIRKLLCEYFMYKGSVKWQWEKVRDNKF